jgi:ferrochelatase
VRDALAQRLGDDLPVALAMRYGEPSIAKVVGELASSGIERVLLFPQYPHYAMSSWETVAVQVYEEFRRQAPQVKVDCVQPFFGDEDYIGALYTSAAPYLAEPFDFLLFSYHGIPIRHLRKADSSRAHCCQAADCCETSSPAHATCYKAQVLATTRAFVKRARLDPKRYSVSFQSRLVGEPWLSPYTDVTLDRLAREGVKRLLVITPAFVVDCLETLEEIAVEGKESFLVAGGSSFRHIPCLNDHPAYIDFLSQRCRAWESGI